jgi:hypothetical protein
MELGIVTVENKMDDSDRMGWTGTRCSNRDRSSTDGQLGWGGSVRCITHGGATGSSLELELTHATVLQTRSGLHLYDFLGTCKADNSLGKDGETWTVPPTTFFSCETWNIGCIEEVTKIQSISHPYNFMQHLERTKELEGYFLLACGASDDWT